MNRDLLLGDFRTDARKRDELREIDIQLNVISGSSGSCLFSIGETKALAWVNGPREGKSRSDLKGQLKCTFSMATFSTMNRGKEQKRDIKMRAFSKTLKDVYEQFILLDLYTRSEIELNVMILQDNGSYKGAAINAATLALINAGIMLKDTVVGICLGFSDDLTFVDLTRNEEKSNMVLLNCAYLPHFNKFVHMEILNSKTNMEQCNVLMKTSEKAAMEVFKIMENYLKFKYINS
jgi:exosome complex component RRP41